MLDASDAPTLEEVRDAARAMGFTLTDADARAVRGLVEDAFADVALAEAMQPAARAPGARRDAGRAPTARENPLGAWAWRMRVPGAPTGPLAGVRVAVKDNVAVAGAPMTAGSAVLQGFEPEEDAVAVARVLAAGARVEGMAACEDLAFSAGSHTSVTGPVRNPFDPSSSAGGSSSGSAVLVATRDVDVALGTDQGGSLTIPAAHCGVVGVKPTHGLVPTRGILSLDASVDHVGPMARTVEDAARVLAVLADRPPGTFAPDPDAAPAHVALVDEGFAWPDAGAPLVDRLVEREVRARFADAGTAVTRASVPAHRAGNPLLAPLAFTALARNLTWRGGSPSEQAERADPLLARALAHGVRAHADALAPNVKVAAVIGHVLATREGARPYALAQRARRTLREAYDEVLTGSDAAGRGSRGADAAHPGVVLALPAVPFPARPLPRPDAGWQEHVRATQDATVNTAPFDLTGHPTVSVNAGLIDGLPVGVLLVGRHGDEKTLLAAARAFEARGEACVPPRAPRAA